MNKLKNINVLSLFDGISSGLVALERANIHVTNYYASEIDKYAIKVSQNNYPDIIRLGDINNWLNWDIDWTSIDLVLAGSPCQGFSFLGKQLAFDDKRSALFFRFAEILYHIQSLNPKVKFLLENVRMKKDGEKAITSVVGVEPIMINSAAVSAQDRKRLYWCNWNVAQPEDKGIFWKDVKSDYSDSHICTDSWVEWWNINKDYQISKQYSALCTDNSKAITMTARQYASWTGNFIQIDKNTFRKLTPVKCERLQTLSDNYTSGINDAQRYKALGNGWTVDVIAHILKSLKCQT